MPPINIRLKKNLISVYLRKKTYLFVFLAKLANQHQARYNFFFKFLLFWRKKQYFFKKLKYIYILFFQSLHLKLEPDQAYAQHWNIINGQSEMIQILERFFDSRVAIPPFRLNAVHAFCKILQSPIEALKDIINILR